MPATGSWTTPPPTGSNAEHSNAHRNPRTSSVRPCTWPVPTRHLSPARPSWSTVAANSSKTPNTTHQGGHRFFKEHLMATVHFTDYEGSTITLEANEGDSVMETAVRNGLEGIVAECGGSLSCATCHVFLDPADADKVPPMSE